MAYIKIEVDGPIKSDLTNREINILQTTFLNLAAMTNAIIVGQGVMLNPPDEGKMGITLVHTEDIPSEKEEELKEKLIKKLKTFFKMSELELTAKIIE